MSNFLTLVHDLYSKYINAVKTILCFLLFIAIFNISHASTDNKAAFDEIVKLAEHQPTKGRSPFVFGYNAEKFSTIKEVYKLEKDYNYKAIKSNIECRYRIIFGRRLNIENLKKSPLVQNGREIAEMLNSLYRNNQLRNIISAVWDESSGRPQDCLIYEINAYSIDGYILTLEFK